MNAVSVLKIWFIIVVSLMAKVGVASETETDADKFLITAAQMREEWIRLKSAETPLPEAEAKKLQECATKWSKQSKSASMMANYFVLRFASESEWLNPTSREMVSSFSIAMLPEGLVLLRTKKIKNTWMADWRLNQCLAELLPVNPMWIRTLNGGFLDLKNENRVPVMIISKYEGKEMLLKTATKFEKIGLWDLAWRTYAEAVYYDTKDFIFSISSETGPLWIKTAECAYRAGKKDLAMDYLMKAAIFGKDDLQKTVSEKVFLWSGNPSINPKDKTIDKEVKRQSLMKVVRLCAKLNAHPRAFQLMDDYQDVLGDSFVGLKKKIEDDWINVIDDHKKLGHGVLLISKVLCYGQEVYPKGDPLKVRIPWAFSDEAVASVRNRLKESISREPMPASSKKIETDK
jgi:hypothetical protein